MTSRDFGFLTLRNIQAFQSNGNPVPANQVLVTVSTGEGKFTSSLNISSINVSTINGIPWSEELWLKTGNDIYNDNTGKVGIGTSSPAYKLDVIGTSRVTSTMQNGLFSFLIANTGATSTGSGIFFQARGNDEGYAINATGSDGSPGNTGLIPSTLQIFSYYPSPLTIFTLYPNGSTELYSTLTVNGNLTVAGSAISRASVTYATTGITLDSTYWGKYVLANAGDSAGYTLILGTTSVPNGTLIVITNAAATTNSISITNVQLGSATILPTKTVSYLYTTNVNVTQGWYALD